MGDLKDQIFGKVTGDQDTLKKIAEKIPGFTGYMDRQQRRDSDKLLRDVIFKDFRALEGRVSAIQRDFISHGELDKVGALEAVAIKLRTFADRIQRAPRGYASLFAAVKINSPELDQLYNYDAGLLDKAQEIGHAIDNVQESIGTDGLPAAIRNLEAKAQEAIDIYDRREQAILTGTAQQE